eukprot:TRINITY_DN21478_c0_g1_i1.p1 TRINITY_DN21478_c0_g1~~TRINITY_DN21478_c0_g1_i1.p1  ORF type:complete len:904 (-),score=174.08 TRINITY_DN21478_c0_g1_i1:757-3468(-)
MDVEQTYNKPKYRGKLYALSDEFAWEDTGTGFVSIVGSDDNRRLVFRDEETGEVLHDRPVFGRDLYQLQGESERQTILVWEDPESKKDWALSFQDPDGTVEVWEAIQKDATSPVHQRVLPLPKLANLLDLGRMLTCVPPSQREILANECMAPKFIEGLREAFHTAEDLGFEEALSALWQMVKGVFLLSNQKLTERYLSFDMHEDTMGMLEYDDGLPAEKRIAHRQVLKVKVRFQQVVAFEDAEILERVHLNYRLQYLKDIVLPRLLDDAAFVSLTLMIHSNLSIILDHLQKNAHLLERLLAQIQQRDIQSLLFLQDMCRQAKQIPPAERQTLYVKMTERKLFEVLAPFLVGSSPGDEGKEDLFHPPRHLVVEILLLSAANDPSHLRNFLTAEGSAEGRAMLGGLIHLMHVEADQGVQRQIAEMLKSVMDSTNVDNRERDRCLDVFYHGGALDVLVAPLRTDDCRPRPEFAQQLVCELLAFAVTHHGYRARVYVLRHGLAQQAARLMAAPQRFLQLAPVRFVRAMVLTKEDAYHRCIVKSGLFAPLMRNLQQSLTPPALGGNLFVSATLELLEFIRIQNIKMLVDHICRKHGPLLQEHASKFKTLEGILLKHQQNLEYEAFPPEQHAAGGPMTRAGGSLVRTGRARSPGRDSDDDEAYFDSVDEDDDDASGGLPQTGICPQSPRTSSEPGASGDVDVERGGEDGGSGNGQLSLADDAEQGSSADAVNEGGCQNHDLRDLLDSYQEEGEEEEGQKDRKADASVGGDGTVGDASVGEADGVEEDGDAAVSSDGDHNCGKEQGQGGVPTEQEASAEPPKVLGQCVDGVASCDGMAVSDTPNDVDSSSGAAVAAAAAAAVAAVVATEVESEDANPSAKAKAKAAPPAVGEKSLSHVAKRQRTSAAAPS